MEINESMSIHEIRDGAFRRGYDIASWNDIPEIGERLPCEIDWIGIDVIESENDQREALDMLAHAGEENDRQFSPNEFWIHAINERPDSDEIWTIVDEAISEGIWANIADRFE